MIKIIQEIRISPLASAGVLLVLSVMLIFLLPALESRSGNVRDIYELHDALRKRKIGIRFTGEILVSAGRSGEVSLLAVFWVCHTLKNIRERIVDNATEIFSVFIIAQICVLLASYGDSKNLTSWMEAAAEHVPIYEIIMIIIFNYVAWRVSSYWGIIRESFQESALDLGRNRGEKRDA